MMVLLGHVVVTGGEIKHTEIEIRCKVPPYRIKGDPKRTGEVTVRVKNSDGTENATPGVIQYIYTPLHVDSITPNKGKIGDWVVITGAGFNFEEYSNYPKSTLGNKADLTLTRGGTMGVPKEEATLHRAFTLEL
jgi:hypothetical protein